MFKIAAIALASTAVFASATVVLARQASGPYIQIEASYPTGNASPNAPYVAPRIAPIRSAPVLPFTWAEKRACDRATLGNNQ
jgi:hypothetical protein